MTPCPLGQGLWLHKGMQTGTRQCKPKISYCGCVNPQNQRKPEPTWEDPSREVAQIFDDITVKARSRKQIPMWKNQAGKNLQVRGTTNQATRELD